LNRLVRTKEELDDMAIADAVTSFLAVKQRDWVRRQRNAILPYVMSEVDKARSAGHSPDIKRLMEDAFLNDSLPLPELA